ncbi:hypothetical protein DFH28DRAFT_405508 [Melampsora americana]|nr:hypothetical protein DFH28DRAFT_405508 [Melampsora americana]
MIIDCFTCSASFSLFVYLASGLGAQIKLVYKHHTNTWLIIVSVTAPFSNHNVLMMYIPRKSWNFNFSNTKTINYIAEVTFGHLLARLPVMDFQKPSHLGELTSSARTPS